MKMDEWIYAKLLRLSDPLAVDELSDFKSIPPRAVGRMLAFARVHGILGIVFDKLKGLGPHYPEVWRIATRSWRGEYVRTLRIRRHAEQILRAFSTSGIPAVILKGSDFADNLYPNPTLRTTRDVDILVPSDRWEDGIATLRAMGHTKKGRQPNMSVFPATTGQGSWRSPPPAKNAVELHWNLICAKGWRQRASVEFAHLEKEILPSGLMVLSRASRFLVAALHPVFHHQFDRIILLSDVRQACRHVGPDDVPRIISVMGATGTGPAVDISLAITSRMLDDPAIEQLRQKLSDGSNASPADIPNETYEAAHNLVRTVVFRRGRQYRARLRRRVFVLTR